MSVVSLSSSQTASVVRAQACARAFLAIRLLRRKVKHHIFRTKVAREIFDSEISYVRSLMAVNEVYIIGTESMLTDAERKILFGNIKEIMNIHCSLLRDLQARINNWGYSQSIGDVFAPYTWQLKGPYQEYVNNYSAAAAFLKQKCASSSNFDKYINSQKSGPVAANLPLAALLVTPIQRLPRYILLLKELLKHTNQSNADYAFIEKAIGEMQSLTTNVNEDRKDADTKQKLAELKKTVSGFNFDDLEMNFVYEGSLMIKKLPSKKKSLVGLNVFKKTVQEVKLSESVEEKSTKKDKVSEDWSEVYVYLFGDAMLCAKKISNVGKIGLKVSGGGWHKYSAAVSIKIEPTMRAAVGPDLTFTLSNSEVTHVFKAGNVTEQGAWVRQLQTNTCCSKM